MLTQLVVQGSASPPAESLMFSMGCSANPEQPRSPRRVTRSHFGAARSAKQDASTPDGPGFCRVPSPQKRLPGPSGARHCISSSRNDSRRTALPKKSFSGPLGRPKMTVEPPWRQLMVARDLLNFWSLFRGKLNYNTFNCEIRLQIKGSDPFV